MKRKKMGADSVPKLDNRKDQEEEEDDGEPGLPVPPNCDRFLRALTDCHRRSPLLDTPCRHLNRALAQCVVAALCAREAEAVRTLCASAGTSLKRSQCQRAQIGLSACLSAHQHQ